MARRQVHHIQQPMVICQGNCCFHNKYKPYSEIISSLFCMYSNMPILMHSKMRVIAKQGKSA